MYNRHYAPFGNAVARGDMDSDEAKKEKLIGMVFWGKWLVASEKRE